MDQKKMRAIGVRPEQREVAIIDHDHPEITAPTQVKVRSLEVGICGTDREICTFVYGSPPEGSDYLVLGHESLGEVVAAGSDVAELKVGDLVVPSVRRPCSEDDCRPCAIDRQDFCQTENFVERGIKEQHGYMTEYWVEDERHLNLVPADLRDYAVLAEPLTIAEKALDQVWLIQKRLPWANEEPGKRPGEGLTAVVLGAGPIGILGAMKLVIEGFKTYVYTRSPAPNPKSDIVEAIGAEYISNTQISPAELAEHVGGIDLIYEGLGVAKVSFDVLMHLGLNGVFCFTGIPAPGGEISVAGNELMRNLVLKNQVIVGSVNANKEAFENAIKDLGEFRRRWPKALDGIITGRHLPDDFKDLLIGKATGIKNVITFA
jgi:threonine dehydrogenase-like Zn-dependent dehydrogenase